MGGPEKKSLPWGKHSYNHGKDGRVFYGLLVTGKKGGGRSTSGGEEIGCLTNTTDRKQLTRLRSEEKLSSTHSSGEEDFSPRFHGGGGEKKERTLSGRKG